MEAAKKENTAEFFLYKQYINEREKNERKRRNWKEMAKLFASNVHM